MRTLALALALSFAVASVQGQSFQRDSRSCFDRAAEDLRSGDPVVVYLNDSTIIRGNRTIFALSSSFLYLMPLGDTNAAVGVTIPFEKIDRFTYKKPSTGTWVLAVAGFGIGVVAGAAIGISSVPEEKRWLSSPEIGLGVLGGTIGGVLGAYLGYEAGKGIKTTVTLKCP